MCVPGAKLYLHVPVPPAPPSSLIFSSSHDLTQWTAFSEGHPHYTTLCVSVCMNAIQWFPQWGWFFFLHSKKKRGRGGPPSFPALGPCGQPWFLFFLPPSGAHLLLLYFCSQPTLRSTLYSTAYPFISPFEASLICSHDWSFFPTPCINKLLKTVYIWNTPYTIQLASNPSQHALACSTGTTAASSVSHACAHTPLRNVHALKKKQKKKEIEIHGTLTQLFHVIIKFIALLEEPCANESIDHVCSGAEEWGRERKTVCVCECVCEGEREAAKQGSVRMRDERKRQGE